MQWHLKQTTHIQWFHQISNQDILINISWIGNIIFMDVHIVKYNMYEELYEDNCHRSEQKQKYLLLIKLNGDNLLLAIRFQLTTKKKGDVLKTIYMSWMWSTHKVIRQTLSVINESIKNLLLKTLDYLTNTSFFLANINIKFGDK